MADKNPWRMTAIDRYHQDPEFATLVETFEYFVADGKFTIGELKQAITIAAVIFEQRRVRPIIMERDRVHMEMLRDLGRHPNPKDR